MKDRISNCKLVRLVAFDKSRRMAVIKFPKDSQHLAEDFVRQIGARITVTNGGFNNPEKLFEIVW